MKFSNDKIQAINTNNLEELTINEIVILYSSYRVVDQDTGDFKRIASPSETLETKQQKERNKQENIEIDGPIGAFDIAGLLVELGAYSSQLNATDKVYQIQDNMVITDDNFGGEKSNKFSQGCQNIHNYMVKSGQVLPVEFNKKQNKMSHLVVGSGKWLKALGLTKKDVLVHA